MKRKGEYICNRCGKVIDIDHDIDCVETKMFEQRNIGTMYPKEVLTFHRIGGEEKLHYCGECNQLLRRYVYSHELKEPVAEDIIRCKDCAKFLREECPMTSLHEQGVIELSNDFFCGYAKRKSTDELWDGADN